MNHLGNVAQLEHLPLGRGRRRGALPPRGLILTVSDSAAVPLTTVHSVSLCLGLLVCEVGGVIAPASWGCGVRESYSCKGFCTGPSLTGIQGMLAPNASAPITTAVRSTAQGLQCGPHSGEGAAAGSLLEMHILRSPAAPAPQEQKLWECAWQLGF